MGEGNGERGRRIVHIDCTAEYGADTWFDTGRHGQFGRPGSARTGRRHRNRSPASGTGFAWSG